ncbi:hypothetical protein TU84_20530 [Pseudomonas helleri]|nr:hypothetical protein TU84_20530 [Pseudomonas helleri]
MLLQCEGLGVGLKKPAFTFALNLSGDAGVVVKTLNAVAGCQPVQWIVEVGAGDGFALFAHGELPGKARTKG